MGEDLGSEEQLGVDGSRLRQMIAAGVLATDGGGELVDLDQSDDMASLRQRFLAEPAPVDDAGFDRMSAGVRIFTVRAAELSDAVLAAIVHDIRRGKQPVTDKRVRRYLGGQASANEIVARVAAAGFDPGRDVEALCISTGNDDDLGALEAVLGERYAAPPGTPLDARLGHRGDAPSAEAAEKAVSHMRAGPFRTVMVILLLLEAARTNRESQAKWLMKGAVPLDRLIDGVEGDPDGLRERFEAYGFGLPGDDAREGRRLHRLTVYRTIHDLFGRWLDGLKPSERRRFEDLMPTMPKGGRRLFERVVTRLDKLAKAGQRDIDDRVQHLVDRPHHASIVASERVAEVLGLRDTARKEIVSAVARGDGPDAFPIDFRHPYVAIRVIDGQVYRFPQALVLRLDRWDLLDRRVARDLPPWEYKCPRDRPYDAFRQPETNGFEAEWVVHYVDCVPQTVGGPVSPPHWLDYHRGRIFDEGMMTAAERALAEAVHRKYEFPESIGQPAAGLMMFEGKRQRLISRHSMELYGTLLLPIEETLHGFAYGALMFQTCLDDGGRAGEGEQIAEDADCWDEIKQDGVTYRAYEGLHKGAEPGGEEWFGIGQESEQALALAIRLSVERWYLTDAQRERHGIVEDGRMLPTAPANRDLAKRGVKPKAWVLNKRGAALKPGAGGQLMRLLMGGYLVIEGHDPRRAFGGGVRKLGADRGERQRLLNQGDPSTVDRYGSATPTEQLSMQIRWMSHLAREVRPEARSMAHVEERRRDVIAVTGGLPPVIGGGCLRRGPCDLRLACFRCADHAPDPERRDDVVYMLGRCEALEAYALGAGRPDDARRAVADAERCRAKLTEIDEVARLRAEAPREDGMAVRGDPEVRGADAVGELPGLGEVEGDMTDRANRLVAGGDGCACGPGGCGAADIAGEVK